jgi:hypothetical protein
MVGDWLPGRQVWRGELERFGHRSAMVARLARGGKERSHEELRRGPPNPCPRHGYAQDMKTMRAGLALALGLAGAGALEAQVPSARGVSVWPGTEVRATLGGGVLGADVVRGKVVTLTADTLRMRPRGTGTIATYPLAEVERLEVRGPRRRGAGFMMGAVIGAGVAAAVAAPDWHRGGMSRDQFAGIVAASGLASGWIGFAFARRDWLRLPLRK